MGYDPHVPEGQAKKSQDMQRYWAGIDSAGMCLFPSLAIDAKVMLGKKLVEAIGAVLGEDLPEGYIRELGAKVLAVEVDFNRRAGFTRKDDRLPIFMVEEPVPPSGYWFDVSEEDLDSVFP
jgi:aldehyde:ferredoxin oxidoreductase